MRYILIVLVLFSSVALAQKPSSKECKEDPRKAGCQR